MQIPLRQPGFLCDIYVEPLEHPLLHHLGPYNVHPQCQCSDNVVIIAFRGSWRRLRLRGQQIRFVTVLAIPTLSLSLSISPLET